MHLHFAPHIRIAAIGRHLVVMDLEANAYQCLPRAFDRAAPVDWAIDAFADDVRADLLSAGHLVTDTNPPGTAARAMPPPMATRDISPLESTCWPNAIDWMRLIAAAGTALIHIRLSPPRAWLRAVERRHRETDMTETEVVTLVQRFRGAATLIPGIAGCLPNSLALILFLRCHHVRTDWIFGVRVHPFEAHCWVQWRDLVLNDRADHIRWFTPLVAA